MEHDWPLVASTVIDELGRVLGVEQASLKEAEEEFRVGRAIMDLVLEAARIFGSVENGLAWLDSPNRTIGDKTPRSLLSQGEQGVEEARAILFRLEDGIYS